MEMENSANLRQPTGDIVHSSIPQFPVGRFFHQVAPQSQLGTSVPWVGCSNTSDWPHAKVFGLGENKLFFVHTIGGVQPRSDWKHEAIKWLYHQSSFVFAAFHNPICWWCYVSVYVCMCECVYVRLCVCLYVCLFVCLYVYMSICLYACMFVCLYVCMSVCLYVCMHACMYVCLYLSIYLSTYLFFYLSIFLFFYCSIFLCVYVRMCVFAYLRICICAYVCMCVCVYVCMFVCLYVYMYLTINILDVIMNTIYRWFLYTPVVSGMFPWKMMQFFTISHSPTSMSITLWGNWGFHGKSQENNGKTIGNWRFTLW